MYKPDCGVIGKMKTTTFWSEKMAIHHRSSVIGPREMLGQVRVAGEDAGMDGVRIFRYARMKGI